MALNSVPYQPLPRGLVMAALPWPFFAGFLHAKNVNYLIVVQENVAYPLLYKLLFHLHLFGDVLLVAD